MSSFPTARPAWSLAAGAGLLALLALAPGLSAQQPPADSVRQRILARLRQLEENRPGVDTAATDTAAGDTVPARPGGPARETGVPPRREAGAAAGAADSILGELTALPGYQVTQYEGANARFDMDSRTLLLEATEGKRAQVERKGDQVSADSAIIYHEGRELVEVHGDPIFTPREGDPVQSRVMFYDLREERGSAVDARTKFQQQATWYVRGDLPSIQAERFYGSHTRFTSCELEEPHYHFLAKEVKMVADGVMVARPVVLYFADVPVAWLPFIAQSLKRGRRSGLLTPVFSANDVVRTSRGYDRRLSNLGFYWAMSDYSDAQLALDWFSNRFIGLTGGLRYRWLRQFLEGSINYRHFWQAEGGQQLALDTNHRWDASERTNLSISARYTSSTDFIRVNSYDPREVTQDISSEGRLAHRFDWGNLSVGANRRQFLSDDRVETTFPGITLSLSPMTLFRAPPNRASWYNNLTWSGSASLTQNLSDLPPQPDTAFSESRADRRNLQGSLSSSLTLGRLGMSQGVTFSDQMTLAVPDSITGEAGDLSEARMDWRLGFDYQQRLVGATTFTPQLSVSGGALRSDRKPAASSFVGAPVRLSFGAALKSDIYGFFSGFGGFSRIRHKVSPSVSYGYSPAVRPTALQEDVFGTRESKARNEITVGLNQTFEAKVEEAGGEGEAARDTVQADRALADTALADTATGPQRRQQARIVNLLSLQTSAVTYDFVRAQEAGDWRDGFTTTRIRNQISSDFLRGLSLSVEHELFRDEPSAGAAGERARRFAPRLSQLNTSFSLSSASGIFRWLGLAGGAEAAAEPGAEAAAQRVEAEPEPEPDPGTILPGGRPGLRREEPRERREGGVGGWSANLSYSLQRPGGGGAATQMMQMDVSFQPTENWEVRWSTSYDVGAASFNDHILTLSRDLHRWDANFDFRQTATGNWSFQFRVQLRDNPDLKFDYDQQSRVDTRARRIRR